MRQTRRENGKSLRVCTRMIRSDVALSDNIRHAQAGVTLLLLVLGLGTLFRTVSGQAGEEIRQQIDTLRGIQPSQDQAINDAVNSRLDTVWKFLRAEKREALPIVREELEAEVGRNLPDQFFLLDLGYFLVRQGEKGDSLPSRALAKIDPNSDVIQANFRQFFNYAHSMAKRQDPATLEIIHRAFLGNDKKIFVPQHFLELGPTLICLFLYGPYGPSVEERLREVVDNSPEHGERVLEILSWIGTPDSVEWVSGVLRDQPNFETTASAVGYWMRLGGPRGHQSVVSLDPTLFDPKTQEYLEQTVQAVQEVTYDVLVRRMEGQGRSDPPLSSRTVEERLQAMYDNYGVDLMTHPADVLLADLPPEQVFRRLLEIRSRMFFRLSDEALWDVRATNELINLLSYKMALETTSQ